MAKVLNLVTAPNQILQQKSLPVEIFDNQLKSFVYDMFETMYNERGIGLAAVQVGVLKRIIVVDVDQKYDKDGNFISKGNPLCFINPEIVKSSREESDFDEGCLSFPGENVNIIRPSSIEITFYNLDGSKGSIKASGMLATCIQHEIDHLNGITISSYLSDLKREMMLKRLTKQRRKN
jgi:peptide deformylase